MTRLDDTTALDTIHALLDGQEWNAEHLERIANVLGATGRVVREPGEESTDEVG